MEVKRIVLISLMTAVLCVISPFSITIAISPVPISFATLGIYLIVMLLGCRDSTISVLLYVILGFVGAPVFTGFTAGVGKVLGPTGGYIIGYIFLAFISGYIIERTNKFYLQFIGMIIGTIVLYLFGTVWLARQAHLTFIAALYAGVIPFVIGDIIKMLISIFAGREIKKVLQKSNLI